MAEQIVGRTINELKIKARIPRPDTDKYRSWNTNNWVRCECSCGKIVELPEYGVVAGIIKSCGHYRSKKAAETLAKIKEDNPTPTAVYITYEGKTMNISEWSKETGIPRSTLEYRINQQLPLDKVFRKE